MEMSTTFFAKIIILLFMLVFCSHTCLADNALARFGNSAAHAIGDAADTVGEAAVGTAEGVAGTVSDTSKSVLGTEDVRKTRQEIDSRANQGIQKLLRTFPKAKPLFNESYAYAVFDSRKISFLMTTGGGTGVLIEKPTGKKTYMRMATGGAGLGMGAQFFQIVHLFQDRATMQRFLTTGIEANAAASAVLGKNSIEQNIRFVDGLASFQLNEAGIMADANLTGTKYWVSDELNTSAVK